MTQVVLYPRSVELLAAALVEEAGATPRLLGIDLEQVVHLEAQRGGDRDERADRGAGDASLEHAQHGDADAGALAQLVEGHADLGTPRSYPSTDASNGDIGHVARTLRRRQPVTGRRKRHLVSIRRSYHADSLVTR